MPVTGGFTSAAAIIMASSQIKGLFGLSYEAKNCMEMWIKFAENITNIRVADTVMGLICIIVLIGLKVSTDLGDHNSKVRNRNKLFVSSRVHPWREV